ncbi:MAG: hypothetical protein WC795_02325 [Candidatus Paceibacterota bacterium]|jgi:hypothetical protein
MKKLIILISMLTGLSACNKNNEKNQVVMYALDQDSTILIYKNGQSLPIVLKKPITLEQLKSFNIPASVIQDISNKKGIVRFVGNKHNDVIEYSGWKIAEYIFIGIVIMAIIVWGLFSHWGRY